MIVPKAYYAFALIWILLGELHLLATLQNGKSEQLALAALSSTTALAPCVLLALLSWRTKAGMQRRLHIAVLVWASVRFLVPLLSQALCLIGVSVLLGSLLAAAAAILGLGSLPSSTRSSGWHYIERLLRCQSWRSVALALICTAGPCIGAAYIMLPCSTFRPLSLAAAADSTGILFIRLFGCNLLLSHTAFYEVKMQADGQPSAASYPMLVAACAICALETGIFLWIGAFQEALREALTAMAMLAWHVLDH